MTTPEPIGADAVRLLAAYADLPLPLGREEVVASVLRTWLADADALSRKMSAPEHWTLAPVTIFSHPSFEDGEG